jgi:hypothetical protein
LKTHTCARDGQRYRNGWPGRGAGHRSSRSGYCAGICQRSERCWSGHCRSCERRGHGGGQDWQRCLVHCNAGLRLLAPQDKRQVTCGAQLVDCPGAACLASSLGFDHDQRNVANRILRERYAAPETGVALWIMAIAAGVACSRCLNEPMLPATIREHPHPLRSVTT